MIKKRLLFLILFFIQRLFAVTGEAGVEELTWIGFSAKMMGLAGAGGAAFPEDPSSFTWNPAGMQVVQHSSMELSQTTVAFGTQYHFIGFTYPTLNTGSFGIGISRIGTGDIPHIKNIQNVPVSLGDFGYYWGKLSLAYSFPLWKYLSTGATFDIHRQEMGDILSNNGFGINFGAHFGSYRATGFLRDFYLGLSMSNVISRMTLQEESQTIPKRTRIGLAKGIYLRNNTDRLMLLADMLSMEHRDPRYMFGAEYRMGQSIFLRGGTDQGRFAMGFGLRLYRLQIDYATTEFSDAPTVFERNHRFSLVFYFGKSVPEQRNLLEETQKKEVERRIAAQMAADKEARVRDGMRAGRQYLDNQDYFNARLEFSRVLEENPNHSEAKALLDETQEAEKKYMEGRDQSLVKEAVEKEKLQRDNTFVNQRFNEGLEALSKEEYQIAIAKWQEALERDPGNQQLQTYIEKAENELKQKISQRILRARSYLQQEKHSEAYKELEEAKKEALGNETLLTQIENEIKRLGKLVDFNSFYQAGLQYYRKGDYGNASKYLEQALKINPDDERTKDLYRNAVARVKTEESPEEVELKGDVRAMFNDGLEHYRQGRYEDALKVWEEALQRNPHNVKLLQAVQAAKDRLEIYQRKQTH